MVNDKTVIIVDGGAGVDVLDFCKNYCRSELYSGYIYDTLEPIKNIARVYYDNPRDEFISDLKYTFDKEFNQTMRSFTYNYEGFEGSDYAIMFVLCDDIDDIDKMKDLVESENGRVSTLYLTKNCDDLKDYHYDNIFVVCGPDEAAKYYFAIFIKQIVDETTWKV